MTIIREIKKRISIILRVAVIISSAWLIVVIFFTTILNRPLLYKTDFSKRLSSSVKKSASSISPDDEFLIKHPVFKNFNIIPPVQKKNVRLLVIVTTAPQRNDRREAIRNTWWTRCKNQPDVECIFITDNLNSSHESYPQVMREQDEFGDMRFQNMVGGFMFGLRYIYHLVYAFLNYDFQYILRTDDDYFVCLDRLLYELPSRPLPMFHWGYVHLDRPSVIRPDESIAMFSKDVIAEYLFQNPSTLYCHAMGDQQVALWTANLKIKNLFRHDSRLLLDDIIRDANAVLSKKSFCEKYIGIHRSLPNYMIHFWKYRYSSNSTFHFAGNLMTNSRLIDTRGVFNWHDFGPEARYEPQLCIKKSVWTSHQRGHPGENGEFYPGFLEYRLGQKLSKWLENPNYSQFKKLGGFDFIQDAPSTKKHEIYNDTKDQ